ncbi:M56 family metallopeptidase [Alkalihalobacillus pseudalcaliphilus]|uniref:M56 family metallopeptidase n=1 Tax=Alkalihalobacillus pseudalcaliphilus TaxID=79884 RepID=UPI00064E104C|nr:M56 family metallopeptidase [Alkalihalobacillus pseudalcaliphilus]KMK74689.1 hypothetical protein AB990_19545 [Alkalihalobacillus pseudalcaliphilus]
MLPTTTTILTYLGLTILIALIEALIREKSNKGANIFLGMAALALIVVLYIDLGFPDVFIPFAVAAVSYSSLSTIFEGQRKARKWTKELRSKNYQECSIERNYRKFAYETILTIIVMSGAIILYWFGPEIGTLSFLALLLIIHSIVETIKALSVTMSSRFYITDEQELYMIATFDARKYPLSKIETISTFSGVDLLKLHPLFTLFTKGTDFITASGPVARLDFPGESLYINRFTLEKMRAYIPPFEQGNGISESEVLPFYHPRNLKRLIGKLYFAGAIKGISVYMAIFVGLFFLEIHSAIIVAVILLVWVFNLYFSDLILKVATDAEEMDDQKLLDQADVLFQRLNLPSIKLYVTDTKTYNGFASGMGIGRSMITLTSETLKLPYDVIIGILAHEAIHVKKRDVLWGQLLRIPYILLIIAIVYPVVEWTNWAKEYPIPITIGIFMIIWLFPIYQSFYSQWMEVRADRLASNIMPNQHIQMALSLETLGKAQDEAIEQSLDYLEEADEKRKKEAETTPYPSLERPGWLWRFLEFQFMPHPPLYWRIRVLQEEKTLSASLKEWRHDRVKESFRFK